MKCLWDKSRQQEEKSFDQKNIKLKGTPKTRQLVISFVTPSSWFTVLSLMYGSKCMFHEHTSRKGPIALPAPLWGESVFLEAGCSLVLCCRHRWLSAGETPPSRWPTDPPAARTPAAAGSSAGSTGTHPAGLLWADGWRSGRTGRMIKWKSYLVEVNQPSE